jgi:thiamine pyrophosphate-dependent acetolactate synthase large subunit-like protein
MIRRSFDDAAAVRTGVDVTAADPVGIARGFGWTADSVGSPEQLTQALREAIGAGGQRMVHVPVPPDLR